MQIDFLQNCGIMTLLMAEVNSLALSKLAEGVSERFQRAFSFPKFLEVAPPVPSTIAGAVQRGGDIPVRCADCGGIGQSRCWLVEEQFYLTVRSCDACGWWRTI